MQHVWRLNGHFTPFVHKATFTPSLPVSKARRAVPSPAVIKLRKPVRELLRPQPALNPKAKKDAQPKDDVKRKPGFIRKYAWRVFYLWAGVSVSWYVYIGVKYTQHHETVPVTGRERYRGFAWFNKALDEALEKARDKLRSAPDAVSPLHDVDAASLTERVSTVLSRIVFTAGMEDMPFKVRYVAKVGPPQAAVNALGKVIINKAMILATPSDSQLAFVLAHEVGHYLANHGMEGARVDHCLSCLALPLRPITMPGAAALSMGVLLGEQALGGQVLIFSPEALVLLLPAIVMSSPVIAAFMYSRYTSRHREYEADLIGLCLMAAAGYSTTSQV